MKTNLFCLFQGFLPDHLNGIYNVYLDEKMDGYNTTRDFMAKLANVCVKKHNETKVSEKIYF